MPKTRHRVRSSVVRKIYTPTERAVLTALQVFDPFPGDLNGTDIWKPAHPHLWNEAIHGIGALQSMTGSSGAMLSNTVASICLRR